MRRNNLFARRKCDIFPRQQLKSITRSGLIVSAIFMPWLIGRSWAQATDDVIDLDQIVMLHQKHRQDLLSSASFNYTNRIVDNVNVVDGRSHSDVIKGNYLLHGDRRLQDKLSRPRAINSQSGEPLERRESPAKLLVNNDLAVTWFPREDAPIPTPARAWSHTSPANLSLPARDGVGTVAAVDLTLYGYGVGVDTLASQYEFRKLGEVWTVEESSGQDQVNAGGFLVKRYRPNLADGSPGALRAEYVIDPQRGFIIVRADAFSQTGEKTSSITIVPRKVEGQRGDFWVPDEIRDRAIRDGKELVSNQIKISEWDVEPVIDESTFALSALGMPEGTSVLLQHQDGSIEQMAYLQGGLVDLQVGQNIILADESIRGLEAIDSPLGFPDDSAEERSSTIEVQGEKTVGQRFLGSDSAEESGERQLIMVSVGAVLVFCNRSRFPICATALNRLQRSRG